jgi:hypothetical protein
MPRLSNSGHWAMGVGGHRGSVDGNFVADAMGPYWLDDQNIVYPTYSNTINRINPFSGAEPIQEAPRGCNDLRGDGGVWAAWLAGYGLFSSTGWFSDIAGLQAVGPDGSIAYTPNRQEGVGCNVRRLDGTEWRLAEGVVYDLQLLHAETAIWTFQQNVFTKGIPVPQVLPGGVWGPKIAYIGLDAYISYFSGSAGVVIHRTDDASKGWIFAGPGVNAYNHDMKAITSNVLRVVASSGAGELPSELMLEDYIPGETPMVPLFHHDEVVSMNKRCYVSWFEFNQAPQVPPPGNTLVSIRYNVDGAICKYNGDQIAQFISGGTVEEIEAKCLSSQYPPVAYWDSRYWPRLPNLPEGAWLGIFGYCYANETPLRFESLLRDYLDSIPRSYNLAIVAQCYTSNNTLTTNLQGLVPPYSRLARDYSNVTMLLVFSDQGRATGLNDHPEVRPSWEKLFDGVTGMPEDSMDNGIVNGVLVDPEKYWFWLTTNENPQDYENVMNRLGPELYKYGLGQQKSSNGVPRGRLFLPWSDCPNAAPRTPGEQYLGVNQDAPCCGIGDVPCKKVDCVDQTNLKWIYLDRDPQIQYQPIGQPEPPPEDINLQIFDYTNPARRGDPLGLVVKFEAASSRPIVSITYTLNDGDLPFVWRWVAGKDGRYFRVQGIKVTVNGDWILEMTAENDMGDKATVRVPVTVTL